MSRSSSLPFVFADGEDCLHDFLDSAKANLASTLATMEMRESNAARGHKLSRLSIPEEAQQDLDLEAKTAEANYQQAGCGSRELIPTGFREFFATILVFVSV
jgi:hypothetical protein